MTLFDDGTLVNNNNTAVAYINFYFGYPVYFDAWDFQYPDDLISWKTTGWYEREITEIEKHRITDLVVGATDTPSQSTVPSPWATEQVNAAIAAGLVPESLQKNYTQPVTRGHVAQIFINLIEQSSGQPIDDFMEAKGVSMNNGAFTDTTDKAVLAANALGIINGVGDNRSDPDGTFTRAQIAAIINRVARVQGIETNGFTHSFVDVGGHWADAELGWPVHEGIINGVGDNRFDPDGKLTTEQAIVVSYRALQALPHPKR